MVLALTDVLVGHVCDTVGLLMVWQTCALGHLQDVLVLGIGVEGAAAEDAGELFAVSKCQRRIVSLQSSVSSAQAKP